jgi:mRNA-degrading endonuclease toxin of MazEF toxin-antitoxin module
MRVYQGEIVEVNFLLPSGEFKPHPTIVISNNLVNEQEDAFIGVMISSSAPNDEFTFLLSDEMLTKPTKRPCQVRTQLISLIPENQVVAKHGVIRKQYLRAVIEKIFETALSVE